MAHLEKLVLLLTLSFSLLTAAQEKKQIDEGRDKMRARLEQLFMWRVSDRLQLTPDKESQFSAEYKKLSDEKTQDSRKMDDIVEKISKETDSKKKAKLVGDYEDTLKKYTQVQLTEITSMKKIFNVDQMADYVLLKRDMIHKFRDVLTTPTTAVAKSPDKKLKEPEVFQEK